MISHSDKTQHWTEARVAFVLRFTVTAADVPKLHDSRCDCGGRSKTMISRTGEDDRGLTGSRLGEEGREALGEG
jgi:hypothetical protein